MNTKQMMAIGAVAVLLAVGLVGAGYAFQSVYTDTATGTGTGDGQFLSVADSTSTSTTAKFLDGNNATIYLNAGIDTTKTGTSAYTYAWDATGAKVSTDDKGTAIYAPASVSLSEGKLTVKAVFCIGSYDITAPQANTSATVALSGATATNTYQRTSDTGGAVSTGCSTLYVLSESKTYDTVAEEAVTSLGVTAGTTPITVYAYAVVTWVVPAPESSTEDVVLSFSATAPVITATASQFGPTS